MRPREERVVVTFATTAAAMAMERLCRAEEVPGRLIPVPRSITAGCGLCWAAPAQTRAAVEALVIRERLEVSGVYTMWI